MIAFSDSVSGFPYWRLHQIQDEGCFHKDNLASVANIYPLGIGMFLWIWPENFCWFSRFLWIFFLKNDICQKKFSCIFSKILVNKTVHLYKPVFKKNKGRICCNDNNISVIVLLWWCINTTNPSKKHEVQYLELRWIKLVLESWIKLDFGKTFSIVFFILRSLILACYSCYLNSTLFSCIL